MKTIINEIVEFPYCLIDDADIFEEYSGINVLVGLLHEDIKHEVEKRLTKGRHYQIIISKLD